jgi:hypothetical protein
VIRHLRATRGTPKAAIDMMIDLAAKTFEATMTTPSEDENDKIEAMIRQFAVDGQLRDALIVLRSLGYALWLEVDEATMQYLIRETGASE